MKKKMVKKVKKVEEEEETIELPMSKTANEDDVDEDYQVADMSDVAAPVIEFVMPNLTTPDEKPSKPAAKSSVTKKPAKQETLTAEILNNEITKMRATITTAKNRLISKSIRRKKDLESKAKKSTDDKKKEQFTKHAQRLGQEIEHMKTIDRDTIAKFALLNQKSLQELKMSADTPVNTRLLYKLACHEVVVKVVESYRQKYNDFNKSAAFFLQRLGLQYSHLKKEKEEKKKEEVKSEENEKNESEDDGDNDEEKEETDEEEKEGNAGSEDFDESDIEMVDSDDDAEKEASAKRRELLLGLIGVKEDRARPVLKPKKRKIQEEEKEKISPAPKITKKAATKEDMKKVLKEQLKSVKAEKPKVVAQKKVVKKVEKIEVEEDLEVDFDEDEPTTLIQKIDLSAGGKIGKKSKKSDPILPKPKSTEDSKEDDEDEGAFFLPKSGISKIADQKETVEVKEKEEKKNRGASKKKAAQTGEMHPSWAASQQKKKEMQSAKPCGKKITFDD